MPELRPKNDPDELEGLLPGEWLEAHPDDVAEEVNRVTQSGYIHSMDPPPVTGQEIAAISPLLRAIYAPDRSSLSWKEEDVLRLWLIPDQSYSRKLWAAKRYAELALHIYSKDQAPDQEWISHQLHIRQSTVSYRLTTALQKLSRDTGLRLTRDNLHEEVARSLTAAEGKLPQNRPSKNGFA